ncbi:PTS N-acetyl glucosamine transporter subunit IIABC [Heyndrickxia shackletonii]|uniref:PTS N-acetyl glucosamine transporter subunit IIABC n=1 Tax=Heyndrickxia shackletonii TaxID=157838 RepID=A0A0Q3WT36_9BACI|nr:N-acetylglucosamine-specific PTS transporter subunit IIBC [Heyndrickxia shackletonii]KQL52493.1 PTS N-acetyl glucosamine transporter subunit IIABC [Heyndrickxia shackletonii]NEY98935.1 PTS transporter subunit EIIC [Heyndrickxia shackletonii]
MLAFLQKIGKSLMLPIAVLPAAGLLLRLGQPDLLNIKFIAEAGNAFFGSMAIGQDAVFSNLALLFAIGVAIGFAKDNNGAAALAGAIGYMVLTFTTHAINPTVNMGVLGGIISGIVAGLLYNRFHDIHLPTWLAFFGGRRFIPIITALAGVILGILFGYIWPYVQDGIDALAHWITSAGAFGYAVYGFLNRLLIPLGLHHIINTLVWFDFGTFKDAAGNVYHGDITRFLHHDPTAGRFTTGFFPIMMFGLPAACFAMMATAKTERRRKTAGLLLGMALTSFVTGVTEPIEFGFMFVSPLLYVIHALLTATSFAVTYLLGIHDSFSFSASLIDYILNYGIAQKPLLLILVGLIYGVIYFIIFYFVIKWRDLKTPGREDEDEFADDDTIAISADDKYTRMAAGFLKGLGGKENLTNIDNCATRLRLDVRDSCNIDETTIKRFGARGVMKTSKSSVQIIVGPDVEFAANALKKLYALDHPPEPETPGTAHTEPITKNATAKKFDKDSFTAPLSGRLLKIEEVPDKVFSEKMMGDGFGIEPSDGEVISPFNGVVKSVFPTNHAIGLESEDGLEVLIHMGLDTVNLKGEGFTVHVENGDCIKQGQKLADMDIDFIKDKVPSIVTPIIFTNLEQDNRVKLLKEGNIQRGDKGFIEIE